MVGGFKRELPSPPVGQKAEHINAHALTDQCKAQAGRRGHCGNPPRQPPAPGAALGGEHLQHGPRCPVSLKQLLILLTKRLLAGHRVELGCQRRLIVQSGEVFVQGGEVEILLAHAVQPVGQGFDELVPLQFLPLAIRHPYHLPHLVCRLAGRRQSALGRFSRQPLLSSH